MAMVMPKMLESILLRPVSASVAANREERWPERTVQNREEATCSARMFLAQQLLADRMPGPVQ